RHGACRAGQPGHRKAPDALQTERIPMARHVLVLTNEDLADANEVPESVRPLLDEAEDVYVVAPTLTTWMHWLTDDRDGALVAADERLRTVFAHMHAGGLKPHGEVEPRTRSPRSPMRWPSSTPI